MRFFIFLGFGFISSLGFSQTITSAGSGSWNSSSTWVGGTVPNAANSTAIIIATGHNVTTDINVTIDQTTIQATGTLTVGGGTTLIVADATGIDLQNNGSINISAGGGFPPGPSGILQVNGQLAHAGTSVAGGSVTRLFFNTGSTYDHQVSTSQDLPIASWSSTSTCIISGTNGNAKPSAASLGQAFGNFEINFPASGYTGGIDLNGELNNIAGNLTILSTGTAFNYLGLSAVSSGAINIGGDLNWSSGTYGYITSTNTVTLSVGGSFICSAAQFFMNNTGSVSLDIANDLTVPSGGSLDFTFDVGGSSINVAGDIDISGTILNSGGGAASMIIDGTTNQSLLSSLNTITDFDLIFSNTSSAVFSFGSNSIQMGGDYSVTNLSTLDLGTGYIAGGGNFNLDAGATLHLGSTHGSGALQTGTTAGNVRVGVNRTYAAGSKIIYNSSGAQLIGNGFPATAVNLEINNPTSVTNSSGATNIIGDLILTDGAFVIGGSSSLDIKSDFVVTSGTISGSSTSDLTFSNSGAIGTLTMTSGAENLQNLTISRSGTIDLGSNLTMATTGTLAFTTSGNLDMAGQTLTILGDVAKAATGGIISSSATNSNLIIGGSGSITTVGAGTALLNTLTFDRAGATFNISEPVTVTSEIKLLAGDIVHISALTPGVGCLFEQHGGTSFSGAVLAGSNNYDVKYVGTVATGSELPDVSSTRLSNLEINGNVTLDKDIRVETDLLLSSGSFIFNNSDVKLDGDLTNNGGSLNQGINTLEFSGVSIVNGSSSTTFGPIDVTGSVNFGTTVNAFKANIFNSGIITASSSAGTAIFSGTTAITGAGSTSFYNVAISSGSLTTPTAMNVGGFWSSNSGTFNAGVGTTVTFNGTSNQNLNTGVSSFNNLVLAGSGGVTLLGDLDLVDNLTISSSLNVSGSDYAINLGGNWNNSGTFNGQAGTVFFDGTVVQDILGTTDFNNITISNANKVEVEGTVNLYGTLAQDGAGNGVFDADAGGSGSFTLKSTGVSGDARIAALINPAKFTGSINVERYIVDLSLPASEKWTNGYQWRYLSFPVVGATLADLQTSGIDIMGDFVGANLPSTTEGSVMTYDAAQGFYLYYPGSGQALSSAVLDNTVAYQVYSYDLPSNLAITVSGEMVTGPVSIPVFTGPAAAGGEIYNMVVNPYPSQIDWDNVTIPSEIDDAIYFTDNTNQSGAGQASVVSYINSIAANPPTGGWTGEIAMGQAFWVNNTGSNGNIAFEESDKTSGTSVFMRESTPTNILRVEITDGLLADQTVVRFHNDATVGFDKHFDARKFQNRGFNISQYNSAENLDLVISGLPIEQECERLIDLRLTNINPGTYTMRFSDMESFDYDIEMSLIDHFSNQTIEILPDTELIFEVTDDTNSFGDERFDLVFSKVPVDRSINIEDAQVCVSETAILHLSGSELGVSYWAVLESQTISEVISGTGEALLLEINSVLGAGSYEIQVFASTGSCGEFQLTNVPSVNVTETTAVVEVTDTNVCYGVVATELLATGAPEGSVYRWYEVGESITMVEDNEGVLIISEALEDMLYQVAIVNEYGCEGPAMEVSLKVKKINVPVITRVDNVLSILEVAEKIQWYLDGEILEGETNNIIEINLPGLYTVTVTSEEACSAGSEGYDVDRSSLVTGIEELSNRSISIYPNPASSMLNVDFGTELESILLFDDVGRIIRRFDLNPNQNTISIKLDEIPRGIYTMQMINKETIFYHKVMVE